MRLVILFPCVSFFQSGKFFNKEQRLSFFPDYKIYCFIWLSFNSYFIYKKLLKKISYFYKENVRTKTKRPCNSSICLGAFSIK